MVIFAHVTFAAVCRHLLCVTVNDLDNIIAESCI